MNIKQVTYWSLFCIFLIAAGCKQTRRLQTHDSLNASARNYENLTAIINAEEAPIGTILYDEERNFRYLVKVDSLAGYQIDSNAVLKNGANYAIIQPRDNIYPFEAFGATNNFHQDDDGKAFRKIFEFVRARNRKTYVSPVLPNSYYYIDTIHAPTLIFSVSDSINFDGKGAKVYIPSYSGGSNVIAFTLFDANNGKDITFDNWEFISEGRHDGIRYLQEGKNPKWDSNSSRSNIAVFNFSESAKALFNGTANRNINLKNIIFRDIYYPIRISGKHCTIENIKIHNPQDGIRGYNLWNSRVRKIHVEVDTLPATNSKTKALYIIDNNNTVYDEFIVKGDLNVPIRMTTNNISVDSCSAVLNNFFLEGVGQTDLGPGNWLLNNWEVHNPVYEAQSTAVVLSIRGGRFSHPVIKDLTIQNNRPASIAAIYCDAIGSGADFFNLKTIGPFVVRGLSSFGTLNFHNSIIENPLESVAHSVSAIFDFNAAKGGRVNFYNTTISTKDQGKNRPRLLENGPVQMLFDGLEIEDTGNTVFGQMMRVENPLGLLTIRNTNLRNVDYTTLVLSLGGATSANYRIENTTLRNGEYVLNSVDSENAPDSKSRSQVKARSLSFNNNVSTQAGSIYKSFVPLLGDGQTPMHTDTLRSTSITILPNDTHGLDLIEFVATSESNVSADTGLRLLLWDPQYSKYTNIGSGTIKAGTNLVIVSGLNQTVLAEQVIYVELISAGTEPNGLSINLRFQ